MISPVSILQARDNTRDTTWTLMVALVALLLVVAAIKIGASLATVMSPMEVEWGEAMIHDHAARIVRGEPLYQPPGTTFFSVATYTPVYYYIAALLQEVFGAGFGPGRVLSLAAALAAAALIGVFVQSRTNDWRASVLAASAFLALGIPGVPPWSALYKESMLAATLSFATIVSLDGKPSRRRIVLAGVIAALAFLTKQTMLIALLAGSTWLLGRARKDAVLFTATALGLSLGVCALMEVTTGAFVVSTIVANVNPFRVDLFTSGLVGFARLLGGISLVALLYLIGGKGLRGWTLSRDLMVYYWFAGGLLVLLTLGKMGANPNHWIPFAMATSVLATLQIWRHLQAPELRPWGPALASLVLVAMNLVTTMRFTGAGVALALGLTTDNPARAEFYDLVERVRAEPTVVLADPPDVIALAGKPILTEPWAMSLAYNERIWPWEPQPLVDLVCTGGISLLILGYPLEDGGPDFGVPRWPAPALEALRVSMALEGRRAGRFIYSYQHPMTPGGCAS